MVWKNVLKKSIKALASLRFAILVMVAIAILVAIGTFVEARYDARAAAKLVYQTWWMHSTLGLLALSLMAVMVDRWPWKKKHTPFLLAHVGIILILIGSWITQKFGLDGSMRIDVGQSSSTVVTQENYVTIYRSDDGFQFREILNHEVDFFLYPPRPEKPYRIATREFDIFITDYAKYTNPIKKMVPSFNPLAGSGLRYQIQNSKVNQSDWMIQASKSETVSQELGPAKIILSPTLVQLPRQNALVLVPGIESVQYAVFHKDSDKAFSQGKLAVGESLDLGWMDLKFRLLAYFLQAEQNWEIEAKNHPTPLTTSAIKIKYRDQERWVLLNEGIRLHTDGALMNFAFAQKRNTIPFPVILEEFEMEKYQGSSKVSDYRSRVEVPGHGKFLISMNEPMEVRGLTFYQSSYEFNPRGEAVATILSVNKDPGREIKYLGALIMSLGIILLFYSKKNLINPKSNT